MISEHKLTHQQFEILVGIHQLSDSAISQRKLAQHISMSLGMVNKVFNNLVEEGYIVHPSKGSVHLTDQAYEALEPYRVKRAVIVAAGFGSRLVPLTFNTPKPLVRVFGKPMVETVLDALIEAGIEEIYLIRGYLGEYFDVLLRKYPQLHFIENERYSEENNISSLWLARNLLESAYICEADLVLSNPHLIRPYEYRSNYLAKYVDRTNDWCLNCKRGLLVDHYSIGGMKTYQMCGISYWTAEDGRQLATDLDDFYKLPGGITRYWDEAVLDEMKDHYKIYVRPCAFDDIIEIDSLSELQELDPCYRSHP